jgi:galactose mutarotase-like enzyme
VLREPRAADGLRAVATVFAPRSGRVMTVRSSEPGVQFYTGNYLDGTLRRRAGAAPFGRHHGFCLETQHFPDAARRRAEAFDTISSTRVEGRPKEGVSCNVESRRQVHHEHFPSIILRPGETYSHVTEHEFFACATQSEAFAAVPPTSWLQRVSSLGIL